MRRIMHYSKRGLIKSNRCSKATYRRSRTSLKINNKIRWNLYSQPSFKISSVIPSITLTTWWIVFTTKWEIVRTLNSSSTNHSMTNSSKEIPSSTWIWTLAAPLPTSCRWLKEISYPWSCSTSSTPGHTESSTILNRSTFHNWIW